MSILVSKIQDAFHQIFFTWMTPLVRYGRQHPLEIADMPALPHRIQPQNVVEEFHTLPLSSTWKFLFAINRAVKGDAVKMIYLAAGMIVLQVSGPILIRALLNGLSAALSGEMDALAAVGIAVVLSLVKIGHGITIQHYFFSALMTQQQIIYGINLRIYLRSLQLTRLDRQTRPVGDIINYLGTDTNAISMITWAMIDLCYSALLILAVFIALFWFLGVSALAALVVLVVISPVARALARRFVKLDDELMKHRDKRVSIVSQIITGIRIVKFFTWEKLIRAEVSDHRERELKSRRDLAITESISVLLYLSSSTLASLAAFSCYIYLGNALLPGTIFASIALFMILDQPFGNLTEYISNIAAAKVSAERIIEFIRTGRVAERPKKVSQKLHPIGIELSEFSARYEDSSENALTNITLKVASGGSLAIVGPVGAGKSSLLLALLREIPQISGTLKFTGLSDEEVPNTGWVPQEPFIRSATVRENIVFGGDEDGVNEALVATALDEDIRSFPAGLATEIGEQGVNLSGGQKQRISLARVILTRPGIVFLDDPLSAVDVATEKLLVERLIFGVWRGITRIIVTHRLEHLRRFDQVVFLDHGRIVALDTFDNLLASNVRFAEFYREHEKSSHLTQKPAKAAASHAVVVGSDLSADEEAVQFIGKEDREIGAVGSQVYFQYLKAMAGPEGWRRMVILLLLFGTSFAAAGIPIVQNLWLSIWTNRQPGDSFFTKWMYGFIGSDTHNLKIYAFLGGVVLIFLVVKNLMWALRSVAAGRALHDRAFHAVLLARVRFFDSNPVGRILNRLSQDVDAVERELPMSFNQMIGAFISTVGSLAVLIIALPPVLLFLGPVFWAYYRLQKDFRESGREVKRLRSISRSPRFAHFKETLEGLTVIRALHRQALFMDKYYKTLGDDARSFYGMISLNRWFSIRVPLLGGIISCVVAIGLIFAVKTGMVQTGTAGMVLIYSLGLWEGLNWCIRAFSEAESRMISVERLKDYGDIKPEASTRSPVGLVDTTNWPVAGSVVFENVVARYVDHLPDVLKGVSFTIPAGQRVGFIGRTGAGKSTIFQLLYRFIDVRSGRILIDGLDIAQIDLATLRRSIAIIPQDPTLFMGTLRSNVDRFNRYSDEELWQALERVQMAGHVRAQEKGLGTEVHENGHNFSQGQRQLLCLARALLVQAKIIVMDEVTASVDVATDAVIQQTIMVECKDQTVLIIAHRLGTVANCHFVIELSHGLVVSQRAPRDIGLASRNLHAVLID
jgi:ABC-type multidrug transport system fused ATPase/permease subunit